MNTHGKLKMKITSDKKSHLFLGSHPQLSTGWEAQTTWWRREQTPTSGKLEPKVNLIMYFKSTCILSVSVFHLVAALPGVFAMSSSHWTRWSLSGSHYKYQLKLSILNFVLVRFLVYQLITVSVLVFFIKQVDTQSIFYFRNIYKRRFLDYLQLPFFSRNTFWGESYDISRYYSEN